MYRNWQGLGYRVLGIPTLRDFVAAFVALIPLAIIIIPLGLVSNFLEFSHTTPNAGEYVSIYIHLSLD